MLLIKFLAVVVMVFDLVILIDGVIRDDFDFVEFSVGKLFAHYCTIGDTVGYCGLVVLHWQVRSIWAWGFFATLSTVGGGTLSRHWELE